MAEVNYKSLLLQYKAGNLVPIIGSDLYKIKRPGQEVIGFEDYLIEHWQDHKMQMINAEKFSASLLLNTLN